MQRPSDDRSVNSGERKASGESISDSIDTGMFSDETANKYIDDDGGGTNNDTQSLDLSRFSSNEQHNQSVPLTFPYNTQQQVQQQHGHKSGHQRRYQHQRQHEPHRDHVYEPTPIQPAAIRVVRHVPLSETFASVRSADEMAGFLSAVFGSSRSTDRPHLSYQPRMNQPSAVRQLSAFPTLPRQSHNAGVATSSTAWTESSQPDSVAHNSATPSRESQADPLNDPKPTFRPSAGSSAAPLPPDQNRAHDHHRDYRQKQQDRDQIGGLSAVALNSTYTAGSVAQQPFASAPVATASSTCLADHTSAAAAPYPSAQATRRTLTVTNSTSSVSTSVSNLSFASTSPSMTLPAQAIAPSSGPSSDVQFRKYQSDLWATRYVQLCNYQRAHGHCLVHSCQDKALARWMKRQRCQYKLKIEGKRSTMTDERQRLLEDIGFVWDSHDVAWEQHFQDLVAYRREKGHCNVPTKYGENPSLGTWCKDQRRKYRLRATGQSSSLTTARIERLEQIGFQWEVVNTAVKSGSAAKKEG